MADEFSLASTSDPFGIQAYIEDTSVQVVPEDRYPITIANNVFEQFIGKYLKDRTPINRSIAENALAEACSKGTSAKRFNARAVIRVESIGLDCTLGDFATFIPADRDNSVRVWAESRPGFADRTYHLIRKKEALRVEVAKANACSLEVAPVAFDYASALSAEIYKSLGSVERHFINANTSRKTGPSRSHMFEGEMAENGLVNAPPPGDVKTNQRALPAAQKMTNTGSIYGR